MASPKIKFKRSSVEGKRPDYNSLDLGELAVNTYDGRIFVRRDTSGAAGIDTGNKLVNPWIENNSNTGIACTYQVNISGLTTFTENVHLLDSDKLLFGAGEDLEIYHDGSHSYISDQGQGNLKFLSNNFRFSNADESKLVATFTPTTGVGLYYNNDLKFETTGLGITVYGETEVERLYVTGISTFEGTVSLEADVTADTQIVVGGGITVSAGGILATGGAGIITATTFIGDGSGLSNIVGVGSGVYIRDNDTNVGAALTINIGDYLSASPIVAGITTISGIGTEHVTSETITVSGVTTFQGNSFFGGNVTIDGNVSVAGTLTSENKTDIDVLGIVTARSGIHVIAGGIDVDAGIVTSTDGFVGNLTGNVTGNLTGIATGATRVYVDESEDDNTDYDMVFLDSSGSGNAHRSMQVDAGAITFNPATNRLKIPLGDLEADVVGDVTGNLTGTASNASQLGSQSGSYYLNYNNFTNTPTIPTNNNQLSNGAGYITTSFTNTNQLVNGAGFLNQIGVQSTGTAVGAGITIINFVGTGLTSSSSGTTATIHLPASNVTRSNESVTTNKTTFTVSGGYTLNQIDVYLNGLKLLSGTDFTATNGSTVVLSSAAAPGDIIEFVINKPFNIASTAVEENFTATNGQTAFTTTQDFTSETYVQVFINGVKIRKSDFTATATNTVTLDDGVTVGDEVDIVLFV